jgi:hypothetical protein
MGGSRMKVATRKSGKKKGKAKTKKMIADGSRPTAGRGWSGAGAEGGATGVLLTTLGGALTPPTKTQTRGPRRGIGMESLTRFTKLP